MRFALILIIILSFQFLGSIYSPADNSSNPADTTPPVDRRILISGVDVTKNQITLTYMSTGKTAVYTLDMIAKITVYDQPGNIQEIEVGQQVIGYIEHDAHSLDSLTVGTAQPAPVGSQPGSQAAASNLPPPHIFITDVDLTKNQVTITDNKTGQKSVYAFDPLAQITIDNQAGSLNDIKIGQQVFSYIEHDAHSLDCLKLGTP